MKVKFLVALGFLCLSCSSYRTVKEKGPLEYLSLGWELKIGCNNRNYSKWVQSGEFELHSKCLGKKMEELKVIFLNNYEYCLKIKPDPGDQKPESVPHTKSHTMCSGEKGLEHTLYQDNIESFSPSGNLFVTVVSREN